MIEEITIKFSPGTNIGAAITKHNFVAYIYFTYHLSILKQNIV